MTIVSIFMYSRLKTATVLRLVITILMFGSLIRAYCYIDDVYWTLVLGSCLCSCCTSFLFNVQTTIANRWFTDKERATATALQSLGLPLGTVLGNGLVAA